MIRYCYRRILLAIPVMVGISLLAFILGLLSPGDPAEFALNQDGLDAPTDAQIAAMREELGLNRPIYVQYFSWFVQVLHGNFGSSYITGKDIPAGDSGAGAAGFGYCCGYWHCIGHLMRYLQKQLAG